MAVDKSDKKSEQTVDDQTDFVFKSVRSYKEGGEVVDPVSGNEKADFESLEAYKEFLYSLDDIAEFRDKKGDKYSETAKRINTFSYPSRKTSAITREKGVPFTIAGNELLKDKEYKDEYFSNNPSHEIIKADGTKNRDFAYWLNRESRAAEGATFLEALVAEFEVLTNKEAEGKVSEKEQGLLDAYRVFLTERTGYNEGGMTVDNQTDVIFKSVRSYAEGGEVVDPVSGNEVPPGSLPEEVRDDIDARLSEGEYVVPADVVRYYGVKFFEDLRTKAKTGLEKMDEEGRIGGEPIGMEVIEPEDDFPFDVSELQTIEDVQGFDEGGDVTRMQNPFANSMGSSTEFKTYVNEQGLTLYIRFVDGKPMDYIPPGYVLEGTPSATAATTSVERESKDSSQTLAPPTESTGKSAKERLSAMSLDELTSAAKFTQKLRNPSVGIAAGALNPILGFAVRLGSGAKIADIDQELRTRLKNPDLTEEQRSQIETARSQFSYVDKEPKDGKPDSGQKLFGGYRSTYEGLKDNDNDGDIDFGDTWLGDLLGFDKDRKVGVQGIGLSESRAGARRYASIDEADEALGTLKNKGSSVKAVPDTPSDTTYKYANADGSARTVVDNAFTRTFNSANIGRNLDDVEKDNLARSAGVSREQYDNMSEYERSERLAGNAKGGLMTKSKKK